MMVYQKAMMAEFKVVNAEPARVIERLIVSGVTLFQVEYLDELTVTFSIKGRDIKTARLLLDAMDTKWNVTGGQTAMGLFRRIKSRIVVITGSVLLLLLSLFLQTRIFFVRVSGNTNVPTEMIQYMAGECGISFGASARQVRSEKVKNKLLEAIPQLQWVGVNTRGCVATVQVEEKRATEEEAPVSSSVSSIVASSDGIVESVTVTSGNPLCQVGQAVKAGEVLVSGYTDCGIILKATQAKAEIYAQTIHKINAVSPASCAKLGNEIGREVHYSLKIGKNLINFDNGSGISQGTCVKMYEESYMTLPGHFSLPVVLIKETLVFYETVSSTACLSHDQLEKQATAYLLDQMIAGKILSADVTFDENQQLSSLSGTFLCSEMIGRTKYEQWLQGDKQN